MKLNLIAAIGRTGQLGLNGQLPWKDSLIVKVQDQMKADLRLFRHLTFGQDLIMGARTAKDLKLDGRTTHVYHGEEPAKFIADLERMGITKAWLCGGAYTYESFAPWVNGLKLISVIDYSGYADTIFPASAYGIELR